MSEQELGVYVHFPYCTRRCPYCDFAVHARRRIPHEAYAAAVVRELRARRPLFDGRRAVTAYFGGGTPGLWRPSSLASVLSTIREVYGLRSGAEVTVEVNPGEIDAPGLRALFEAGVTRVSIGAQSFDDRSLRVLGRTHDARAAREAVALARRAGFANVSVDLMFGLPGGGRASLDRELEALCSLEADHVSVYGLTIEPRTAFSALVRTGDLVVPAAEQQAEQYERVGQRLAQAGYVQHEISSWARPGHASRHNSLYWRQVEYLGVGSSASSLRIVDEGGRPAGRRFANLRSVDRYLEADRRASGPVTRVESDPRVADLEALAPAAFEREALWLGLRLTEGIDRAWHRARYGRDPFEAGPFQPLVDAGLIEVVPGRVRLSPRGRLLADEVGARLV